MRGFLAKSQSQPDMNYPPNPQQLPTLHPEGISFRLAPEVSTAPVKWAYDTIGFNKALLNPYYISGGEVRLGGVG